MLVLDTIAPTTLAAEFTANSVRSWTVEATIKSTSGFDVETLRALYRHAASTGNTKVQFVCTKAAALKAEREAAHAEALAYNTCTCSTYDRCARHRMQDARRATTANGAIRALHRAYND